MPQGIEVGDRVQIRNLPHIAKHQQNKEGTVMTIGGHGVTDDLIIVRLDYGWATFHVNDLIRIK